MDRVKVALAVLKKQHFWFLISIATISGLVAWYSGSSTLSQQFDGFASKINQTYVDLDRVKNEAQHPNEAIIEGLKQQTDLLRLQVADVWRKLHAEQRSKVLKWPEELKEDFIDFVSSKKFGDDIHIDFRERYQNYVKERFRELPQIVKARELVDPTAAGLDDGPRRRNPNEPEPEPTHIVVWEDQDKIQRKYDWDDAPSALRVWVTQEELWVYETLLNIVKETNHLATGPHNATISVISAMEVGQEAGRRSSSESRVERSDSGGGGEDEGPLDFGPGASEGDEGADAALSSSEGRALMESRYLDADGKPMPAGSSATSGEFKRMPIRLVLQMNPREVPRLITACANAALPVEINQVRINAGGIKRSHRETAIFEAMVGSGDPEETGRRQPHLEVVVHGIIYIFNPLDPQKLGLDKLAERQGDGGQPAPQAPAAQPTAKVQTLPEGEPAGERAEAPKVEEPAPLEKAKRPAEADTDEPAESPAPAGAATDDAPEAAGENLEDETDQADPLQE